MWTRESVKTYAKDFLKKHYWKAFVVCLIVIIVSGNHTSGSNRTRRDYYNHNPNLSFEDMIEERNSVPIETNYEGLNFILQKVGLLPLAYIGWGLFFITIVITIIIAITIGSLLEVGKNRFFLRGFEDDVSIRYLFSTFRKGEAFGIVKNLFVRDFFIFLWSLLLIIPGVIKSYEYRMVSYILTENPNIGSKEAIQRSKDMTEGHKWNILVLDLSFIGWYLLGMIFFGIGGIFVKPYREATMARLYNVLSGNDDIQDSDLIIEL